jgi:hypothetical protein
VRVDVQACLMSRCRKSTKVVTGEVVSEGKEEIVRREMRDGVERDDKAAWNCV